MNNTNSNNSQYKIEKDIKNDYDMSEDKNLYQYIQDVLNGTVSKKSYYKLSDAISKRMAKDIKKIVGFSVEEYGNEISAKRIIHITERHGVNGRADQSMSDYHNIAKIAYVIDNYDKMMKGKEDREYKNRDNTYCKNIILQKCIEDKFYYVVEAVPDSKLKKIRVVSAFINRNDTFPTVANAKRLNSDVRNEL